MTHGRSRHSCERVGRLSCGVVRRGIFIKISLKEGSICDTDVCKMSIVIDSLMFSLHVVASCVDVVAGC
jgi:hypothetical protein